MDRVFKKRFGRLFAALMSTALLAACSNNPFNPAAEPRVIGISASNTNILNINTVSGGATSASTGIRSLYAVILQRGTPRAISYGYSDPIVRIQNRAELPPIDFISFTVEISLADGTRLPVKEYPLSRSMIQDASISIEGTPGNRLSQDSSEIELLLPILSANEDLLNVVFPGNNAPRVKDGRAKIKLIGRDLNGHNMEIELETSLRFETVVFNSDGLADIPQEEAPQQGQNTNVQSPTNSGGQ